MVMRTRKLLAILVAPQNVSKIHNMSPLTNIGHSLLLYLSVRVCHCDYDHTCRVYDLRISDYLPVFTGYPSHRC